MTEISENRDNKVVGTIFYDAECALCVRGVERWRGLFERRGFRWQPIQTPGTADRLGITEAALWEAMCLARADGTIVRGADAWAVLLRSVWWLWPVGFLMGLPAVRWVARRCYRWIAGKRYCFGGRCECGGKGKRRTIPFLELP